LSGLRAGMARGAYVPDDPATELRYVRAELAALRAMVAQHQSETRVMHMRLLRPNPARHGWLKFVVKDLETNPRTQYKVHLYGAVYWLANFPLVTALFFFEPTLWLKLGIFITLVYSIYANFATDYGGMSAAMASFGDHPLPEIPGEPPAGQSWTIPDSPGPDNHGQPRPDNHGQPRPDNHG
jgi:hypothetical protein